MSISSDIPIIDCFYYTAFWSQSYESFLPFLVYLKQKYSSWCNIQEIYIDHSPEKAKLDNIVEIPCFIFYTKGKRLDLFTYTGSNKIAIENVFLSLYDMFYDSWITTYSDATVSPSTESKDE